MSAQHLIDTCLARTIGEGGLSDDGYARALQAAAPALGRLREQARAGSLALLELPARRADLEPCRHLAAALRERCDTVVVLGTGGSSLGGQTLYALADRGFGPPRGAPRLHFVDNIDPDSLDALIAGLEPGRTGIVAISKSGSTAETLAQVLVLLPQMEKAVGRAGLAGHMAVITEPKPSPLRALAEQFGLPCLDHDPDIGGRYSVLSNTGLLPALIAGLDAEALREGAAEALAATLDAKTAADAPPAAGAALAVGLLGERRVTQSVLMPYADRLARFALWYRQLWAESLGKDGTGTTPINALGAVDQHSQLQLYLDGPADKLFTLVLLEMVGQGPRVDPALASAPALAYLRGRTLGDLLDAMARATAETLARNGRPVRLIKLARLDERALGGLLMHFMLETVIAADLLGVNPFDQPAVEQSKALARSHLGEAAA